MKEIPLTISVYDLRAMLAYLQAEERPEDADSRNIVRALVSKIQDAIKKADSDKMTVITLKLGDDFKRQQSELFHRTILLIARQFKATLDEINALHYKNLKTESMDA